jgi:hypothetical protein
LYDRKGVLAFREVPEGNPERLEKASMSKKNVGEERLKEMSLKFQLSKRSRTP